MKIIEKTNTAKLLIISAVMFLLAIGFFLILLSNLRSLRKECPIKWVQIQNEDKQEYFVYEDASLKREEVDLDWILSNCEISKDIVY